MEKNENAVSRIEKGSGAVTSTGTSDKPYYVVLPCEVKDFRSFVSGLLGKPQELRGEIEGTFKITFQEITNIYHLLEQRMEKQNDASLVHFAVKVYYSDGNSVTHNNIQDFEKYHPTTKCYATEVIVSATYLIKFRGHETPEKQEIDVSFAIDAEFKKDYGRWFNGGLYEYRIRHTERTWATDIAGLLNNHGSTIVDKIGGVRKFFRRRGDEIAIYFSQLVFLISIFVWSNAAITFLNSLGSDVQGLMSLAAFCIRSLPAFALLIVTVISVKTYVDNTPFFIGGSGILFTEHDKDRYKKLENQKFWGVIRYMAIQVFSIASGVVSSIIYSKNWFWSS